MVESALIYDQMGGVNDALLSFGSTVGVIYSGLKSPSVADARAKLVLNGNIIRDNKGAYLDIIRYGTQWSKYKIARSIYFDHRVEKAIEDRVSCVKLRAHYILKKES